MSLQDELKERSSKIFRESYQMSIGELINLYRDGEMDIHPNSNEFSDGVNTKRLS